MYLLTKSLYFLDADVFLAWKFSWWVVDRRKGGDKVEILGGVHMIN